MADYQRVIEILRDLRQGGGGGGPGGAMLMVTPEITQVAADFAALCTAANERLRQCSAFLQQGLRSEAIHMAEQPPNLLDLVAQLDLPDPQVWAEFCQNNGLAVPPPLQLERAALLNEAYAQEQPLEHLLARHRLLALARGPVRERLEVIRKIAQLDPGAPYWEKDIRVLEHARLKELPTAFYNAVKDRDEAAIARLMEEIDAQRWFEPMPADLSSAVRDAFARMQRAGVEGQLRKLVPALRDAYAARSLQECQALVQRWKNIMAAGGNGGGVTVIADDLMDEIKPVVVLIAEQSQREEQVRRFNETIRHFTRLLDADAPESDLEAAYARLKSFPEEIPEFLTRRFEIKRVAKRRRDEQRHKQRMMTIAGLCALAVIVVLGVFWLIDRASAAQEWARKIDYSVKRHTKPDMDQAQREVDGLKTSNPGMLKEAAVADAVGHLQSEHAEYNHDFQSLVRGVARLESARNDASAAIARPDVTLPSIRDAALRLQGEIKDGQELGAQVSWVDVNGNMATALAAAQDQLGGVRDRIAKDVKSEIASISGGLRQIPESPTTPEAATDAQNKIAELWSRVGALRQMPLLDDADSAQIQSLAAVIGKRRLGADTTGAIAQELQNIRNHSASVEELKAALEAFDRQFPADPRAADFKTALQCIGPAESLQAWRQLIAGFENRFAPTSQQMAQRRLDALNAFTAAHGDSPKNADAAVYTDYLRHAIDALADKGAWQTSFADLLATPLLSDLSYMDVSDGRRFFTLGDVNRKEQRFNERITVRFDALDLKDLTKRVTVTIEPPLTVSREPIPMPHTKAVLDISDSLKQINETNWDSYGIDLADRLAHNDRIDLIVKAILVQQVLKTEVAVAGWALGDIYDHALGELGRQNPQQLPWLDATRISEGTRQAIKQTMEALPSAATAKARLAQGKADLFKSLQVDVLGTGVLLKDDVDQWNVYSKVIAAAGGKVWMIVPGAAIASPSMPPATTQAGEAATQAAPAASAAAVNPSRLVLVGEGIGGKYHLDDNALQNAVQGGIVFITRP